MSSRISDLERQSDQSSQESQRKKRRKIDTTVTNESAASSSSSPANHQIKWRSPAAQKTYSSKLVQALRQVRRNNNLSSLIPPPAVRGRAIRDTADKILAIAARGRTRWSRAILKNRLKLRLKSHKKAKSAKSRLTAPVGSSSLKRSAAEAASAMEGKTVPPLQRRVQVLGRLVPGCRKLSFPNLLEEATDYIAALEMQVRAMAELAELLSGASQAGTTSDRPPEGTS